MAADVVKSNRHPVSINQERRLATGNEVDAAARATLPGPRAGVVLRSIETAAAATAGLLPLGLFPLPSFPFPFLGDLGDGLRAEPECLYLQSFPNLHVPEA
mgnify:CR=1 FL=1